jgi:hypothetical protein
MPRTEARGASLYSDALGEIAWLVYVSSEQASAVIRKKLAGDDRQDRIKVFQSLRNL